MDLVSVQLLGKGDCGYTANNPEEMIDDYANFFADISPECAEEHRAQCWVSDERHGIYIFHKPWSELLKGIPVVGIGDVVKVLSGEVEACDAEVELPEWAKTAHVQFKPIGRGTWTAETLDDARQMAVDFAEDVS